MTASPKMDDDALSREDIENQRGVLKRATAHRYFATDLKIDALCDLALSALESRSEVRDGRFEAFAHAVTNMVTYGPWDLRDSPKSFISNVQRLCNELLGISPRAEPGAPFTVRAIPDPFARTMAGGVVGYSAQAEHEPDHAADDIPPGRLAATERLLRTTPQLPPDEPASTAPDCGHTFDGKAIRPCPICDARIKPTRGET